jgi:hypothetical protein
MGKVEEVSSDVESKGMSEHTTRIAVKETSGAIFTKIACTIKISTYCFK